VKKPTPEGHTIRGHVIRLDPTVKQTKELARAAGVSRFTYNWALAEWGRQYLLGEKPSTKKLKKQFNAVKKAEFPWVYESPRDANARPFTDLNAAFGNFFKWCKTRKGPRVGYPRFRRRGTHDSFYVSNDRFSLRRRGKRGVARLPVIGDVRMQEHLRFDGKILSGRVYREADQWFLSVNVEFDTRVQHVHEHAVVGIDLGLKTAVVPSHGEPMDAPKPLRENLSQLRRANRRLQRRMKGGKNRYKAQMFLARVHQKIANVRKDFWQKTTTRLCRENQTVVIEDLGMSFMLRNRKLARAATDVGLGRFKPMLLYKAPMYGGTVVVADRLFPSTQRCSGCGFVKTGEEKIVLGVSEYTCDKCGLTEDRDRNAALNLEQYPRLVGNWDRKVRTPMDDCTSTSLAKAGRASVVAEVGTESCMSNTFRRAGAA
jgi:putative transposase